MPLTFEEISTGQRFEFDSAFSAADMDRFAELSGDHSPIHTDPLTARQFGFPDRLQYGFLLTTLLSRLVGTHFAHAVCASLSLDFVQPALPGQRIQLAAEVSQIQTTMRSVALKFTLANETAIVARGKLTTVFLSTPPTP